jgi:serine/threonine protein kinase
VRAISKLCDGIGHPNIINIFEHGWIFKEHYFIDMELLAFSLRDLFLRDFKTPLGPKFYCTPSVKDNLESLSIWGITVDMTAGLEYIHSKKQLHRDLKPENGSSRRTSYADNFLVLFCPKTGLWKITDFGLTKDGTSWKIYPTPQMGGTDGYKAPETVKEKPEDRMFCMQSDIFALGCIFYQLAFDNQPFQTDIAVYRFGSGAHHESPRLSKTTGWVSAYVEQFVASMIQVDWWQRPSAKDIGVALKDLHDDIFSVQIPLHPPSGAGEPASRALSSDSKEWNNVIWRPYWYTRDIRTYANGCSTSCRGVATPIRPTEALGGRQWSCPQGAMHDPSTKVTWTFLLKDGGSK